MPLVEPKIEKKIERFIEYTRELDDIAVTEKKQIKKLMEVVAEKESKRRSDLEKLQTELNEYFDKALQENEEYKQKIDKFEFYATKKKAQTPRWNDYINSILDKLNDKMRKIAEEMRDNFREIKLKIQVRESHVHIASFWKWIAGIGGKLWDKISKLFSDAHGLLDELLENV